MAETGCRYFNGYKPCGRSAVCDVQCPERSVPNVHILIVHLEALGAVLRSTALLPAIKRKFPSSHITWVTQAPAHHLLAHNPLIDRVLTTSSRDLLALSALQFDVAFQIDKSLVSGGVLHQTQYDLLFGFTIDAQTGAILPATPAAEELWHLGLDNYRKFFVNQKTENRLIHEALELGPYLRDEYSLALTDAEQMESARRRKQWAQGRDLVVGVNTGCSPVIPYKKLGVFLQRQLVQRLTHELNSTVVLLGGAEDEERNQQIGYGFKVVQSPTGAGLRDGLTSVAACDVVVTGDSLGLHMAVALRKWVVAWFGPTCAQEIELYDRGVKIHTQAGCSPCWKRSCQNEIMCYDQVALEEILNAVTKGCEWVKATSSFKPHLSETCSSPSR